MRDSTLLTTKIGNRIYTSHESTVKESLRKLLDKMGYLILPPGIKIKRGFGSNKIIATKDKSFNNILREVNTERLLNSLKRKERKKEKENELRRNSPNF
jgi:hypothetical protein